MSAERENIVKSIRENVIFMILGVIVLLLEINLLKLDGILGWALTTIGVLLIVTGLLYKSKNPIKVIVEFIANLL